MRAICLRKARSDCIRVFRLTMMSFEIDTPFKIIPIKTAFRSFLELSSVEITCELDTSFVVVLFSETMFFSIYEISFIDIFFCNEFTFSMISTFL